VVARPDGDSTPLVDVAASDALRARLRAERPEREPFVDRGPGYARLSPDGAATSPVDWL
jgi:N-methylhydantoinase B